MLRKQVLTEKAYVALRTANSHIVPVRRLYGGRGSDYTGDTGSFTARLYRGRVASQAEYTEVRGSD